VVILEQEGQFIHYRTTLITMLVSIFPVCPYSS
jgi:hypothetical protein